MPGHNLGHGVNVARTVVDDDNLMRGAKCLQAPIELGGTVTHRDNHHDTTGVRILRRSRVGGTHRTEPPGEGPCGGRPHGSGLKLGECSGTGC